MSARPLPVPDESSAPFWSAAADHVLTAARCGRCGQFTMPPGVACPHCRATDPGFEFTPVTGRGVVRSWTVVRQAFLPGFDGDLPFVLVDVELVEDEEPCHESAQNATPHGVSVYKHARSRESAPSGLRLIGRLLDGPKVLDAELHVGDAVTVAFEDLAPGVAVPAFELA